MMQKGKGTLGCLLHFLIRWFNNLRELMSTNCKGVISYIIIAGIDQCLIPIDPWPYDDDDVSEDLAEASTTTADDAAAKRRTERRADDDGGRECCTMYDGGGTTTCCADAAETVVVANCSVLIGVEVVAVVEVVVAVAMYN